MNLRVDFWKNVQNWPRDSSSYVFLARAVQAIGKRMFPDEWTGTEPQIELMPNIPEKKAHDVSSNFLVKRIANPDALRFPDKPTRIASPGGFTGGPPKATDHEWRKARALVAEDHAEKLPGMKRLAQVQEHIIACAESGKLETAVRARVGGDFTTLRTWYWNSERLSKRFDLCQMDPDNPFGIYSAGDLHWWIYVGRESLEAQLSALSGTTKQSASAETQCGKWLEQQFKQYETKRWSKGKFQSTAVEKFGTALGKRAFQRAWDRAVAKPGNESRKAAGAKRKLP